MFSAGASVRALVHDRALCDCEPGSVGLVGVDLNQQRPTDRLYIAVIVLTRTYYESADEPSLAANPSHIFQLVTPLIIRVF